MTSLQRTVLHWDDVCTYINVFVMIPCYAHYWMVLYFYDLSSEGCYNITLTTLDLGNNNFGGSIHE